MFLFKPVDSHPLLGQVAQHLTRLFSMLFEISLMVCYIHLALMDQCAIQLGTQFPLKTPLHSRQDEKLWTATGSSQVTSSRLGKRLGCPPKELGTFRGVGQLRQPTQLTAKSQRHLAGQPMCHCLSERSAISMETSWLEHQQIHFVPESFQFTPAGKTWKTGKGKAIGVARKLANKIWQTHPQNGVHDTFGVTQKGVTRRFQRWHPYSFDPI